MDSSLSLEDRISARYGALSGKLQAAADYVVAAPLEVATRSLRSVAATSGLAPSTFSRLARALGFDSYEELRELSRRAIEHGAVRFSDKARRLRAQAESGEGDAPSFLSQHAAASVGNIEGMVRAIPIEKLQHVVDRLASARKVSLVGSLSSRPIVDYMLYLAGWISDDWAVAAEGDASLATALSGAGPEDAFIVVSMPPFARITLRTAELAAEKGAFVLVITDTHTCPALKFASASFLPPSESPHFFSSYVPTLVLIETLVSMLAAQAGPGAEERIHQLEEQNRSLGRYWSA